MPVNSIMRIAEGLLEGKYNSGLTTLETVEKYPGAFRVDTHISTVDDPWIVYGRRRLSAGKLSLVLIARNLLIRS